MTAYQKRAVDVSRSLQVMIIDRKLVELAADVAGIIYSMFSRN